MKLFKISIAFLAFFFLGISLNAQPESYPKNEMNYQLGLNSGLFKDQNFSPLNYSNIGGLGAVEYSRFGKNPNTVWSTSLELNYNEISTDAAEIFSADLFQANIRFSYLKKIKQKDNRLSIFLGPEFQSNNSTVFFNGTASFTYLFAHSLNAKAMATYQLDDSQSLKMKLSVPVVHWLVRPPHAGFNKTTEANQFSPLKLITAEGEFTSINDYVAVDWNLEYAKKLNKKFSLTLGYALNFQRIFADEKMIRVNNQLTVGLRKQF